jgi:anti-sigma B factor antagonist
MDIVESTANGVVVLGVRGRLDAGNADALEGRLLARIDAGETRLVIDCAGLDYISSAGLRVLLVAAKRLRARSGAIAVAALKDDIKEVFDIAGFASIFPICATAAAAVAAVQ